MCNELVGYSRAGDVFHYRWAARRCLEMVHPNSNILYIDIEGSEESTKRGEYVIDVSEYYSENSRDISAIRYFQLKHTTVRNEKPFLLSDFKNTLEGFAHRYQDISKSKGLLNTKVTYEVITNRPIASSVLDGINSIAEKAPTNTRFLNTLEQYCGMSGDTLSDFCRSLRFTDTEGNYQTQKELLFHESAKITASPYSNPLVDTLTALVQDKVLPNNQQNSKKRILPENVLIKFGVTTKADILLLSSKIPYILANKIPWFFLGLTKN